MIKEFIPYELALELKQLGFNEPCFYVKLISNPEFFYTPTDYDDYPKQKEKEVLIPTYSQAFRWFREKHNLHSYIDILKRYNGKSVYEFVIVSDDIEEEENNRRWKNYEEAEFECLKELIEIVKEIKNE